MNESNFRLGKKVGLGLVCSTAILMTACGGGSDSRSSDTPTPTQTAAPTATPAPTTAPTATPAPTDPPAGSKVSGPLDPVQDDVVTAVVADTVAPQLPAPLNDVAVCAASAINTLVDIPDAAIVLAQSGPTADPMVLTGQIQTSLETFANQMQNLAFALNGDGNCDEDHPQNPFTDDQFAGTPLAPLVDALEVLADELATQAASQSPDLAALTAAVDLSAIAAALNALPVGTLPVFGEILATLVGTANNVDALLPAIGSLDNAATQAGVETLLSDLINGVLLNVVPVAASDDANNFDLGLLEDPSDVAGTVQTLINTLTGNFGGDLANVIPANFSTLLNSVTTPSVGSFGDLLGGANPLEGVLAELAGQGVDADLEMLTALLLIGDAGLPIEALAAALGGNVVDASPLDVIEALTLANGVDVSNLLNDIVLNSALAQVPVLSSVVDMIDLALGGALDDLLNGLFSGLLS